MFLWIDYLKIYLKNKVYIFIKNDIYVCVIYKSYMRSYNLTNDGVTV